MTFPNTDTTEDYDFSPAAFMCRRLREIFPDRLFSSGRMDFIVIRFDTPMDNGQKTYVAVVRSAEHKSFLKYLTCDNIASCEYEKILTREMQKTVCRRRGVPMYGMTECDNIVRFYRWKYEEEWEKGRLELIERGGRTEFNFEVGKEYDEALEVLEGIKVDVMGTFFYY
ncbi:hypothetical protein BO94DRAFT_600974 [Aspergillus sclerotioniger CBS 115572]|uniref:Uncharacterized protein n=1 Tax=Aspergillus sclerotioniger CBS 115572 TaxID=1450535 RepID=A0A317XEB3_9EURO|nr:hypothetical protein BO94DRAFT_600974 [Aspergillus sclerotioniger CBS 115572]PWY95977.1 hypothetical protein BO94DRAFT_600974 [Aspergillus sclerotioniger CBS 115572]